MQVGCDGAAGSQLRGSLDSLARGIIQRKIGPSQSETMADFPARAGWENNCQIDEFSNVGSALNLGNWLLQDGARLLFQNRWVDKAVVAVLRQSCAKSFEQTFSGTGIHVPKKVCHEGRFLI